MTGRGQLIGASKDWKTGKVQVTFAFTYDVTKQLDAINGKELTITANPYHEHRSLSANAYYHVLLNKVASALRISTTRAHNLMLRRYGQDFIVDGQTAYIPLPDTEEAERTALESDTFHLKPTSEVREGKDGKMYRTYKLLRGSHDYDTKEMSVLIDGLVSEAKEIGIETLTPQELQEMYRQNEKRNK